MKALLLSLLFTQLSFALDLQLGPAAQGGSGCLPGLSQVDIAPFEIHLKTQGLSAKSGREVCTVAVPALVPEGKRLIIEDVTLIGSHKLPKKSTARISAEAFFAGSTGKVLSLALGSKKIASQGDIDLSAQRTAVSACGQDATVRLNTSVFATGKGLTEISDVILKLRLEDCL